MTMGCLICTKDQTHWLIWDSRQKAGSRKKGKKQIPTLRNREAQSCRIMMTRKLPANCQFGNLLIMSWICINRMFCSVILLLVFSRVAESKFIVKSLPGFSGELPFSLETGYLGVGESDEAQLFYYFIESENNPNADPLILWLTGGPGCSGLSALLYQIGPITFDYAKSSEEAPIFRLHPYSWTKVASIIFLDLPVGTGFSYGKTTEAYTTSDTLSTAQAYDFLRKWLVEHPKFLHNPLYISGDSYTGKIVPPIVQRIYNGNEAGKEPWMNIKGYTLGNPITDDKVDHNAIIPFAHGMALLSDALYESTRANCHGEYEDVDPNNIKCQSDLDVVEECLEKIRIGHILEPWCDYGFGVETETNLLSMGVSSLEENSMNIWPLYLQGKPWCREDNYVYSARWANDRDVQIALHVRQENETHIKEWVKCNKTIKASTHTYDILSAVDYHRNLTNKNCRAMVYSGDHDMIVPYLGTMRWIESLNLTVEIDWKPWFVEGQVAGYTMKHLRKDYELTYATVKGAGHTGPEYKPKECLAMISRWLSGVPL